jgi:hypothetical protein
VTPASIIPVETGANSDGLATTMFPAATGDMRARQARTFRAVPWRETGENARWAPHADSSEPRGTLVSRTSPFGQIHPALRLVCCKFPWGPADNVKESGNALGDRRSSSGGKQNRRSFSARSAGIFDILSGCAMLRSCWRNAVWKPIIRRSGDGCSVMAPS